MTDRRNFKDGYKPSEKGYKPASQPKPVDMPSHGKPGAGYQPSTSQGDNPGNPPKKP